MQMTRDRSESDYFILFPYVQFVRGVNSSAIYDLFDSKVYWFRGQAVSNMLACVAGGRPIREIMGHRFIPEEDLRGYLNSLKSLGVGDYSPVPLATELYRPWALDSQVKKNGLGLQGGTVTLEITNECVYDCEWCASRNSFTAEACGCRVSGGKAAKLGMDTIVESIKLLGSLGFDRLVISGGEPFLEADRLFSLIEIASGYSMKCEVHTTGFIEMKDIEGLREFNIQPVLMIADADADRFDRKVRHNSSFGALQNTIEHLVAKGVTFSAKIPAKIHCEDEAMATAEWALSQGAASVKFLLYGEPNQRSLNDLRKISAPDNPSDLSVGLRQFMINSQRQVCFYNSIFIGFDGSVKPCPGWEKTFATLAQEDMTTILWNGFLDHFSNTSRKDVVRCSGCEFRFGCSACLVRTVEWGGSMNSRHWLCNYEPESGEWLNHRSDTDRNHISTENHIATGIGKAGSKRYRRRR